MKGRRIDQYTQVSAVGVPFDLGWAIGVLNADETVTRTCKACHASATTPVTPAGEVTPAPITHEDGCPIYARLGNNPVLS
jgi:hypothetical protein